MIVLVTGTRRHDEAVRDRVEAELLAARRLKADWYQPCIELVVGDCPTGADVFARTFAKTKLRWMITGFAADWDALGRRAGPDRNRRMVEYVLARRAEQLASKGRTEQFHGLAFWSGERERSGTLDCMQHLIKAGLDFKTVAV